MRQTVRVGVVALVILAQAGSGHAQNTHLGALVDLSGHAVAQFEAVTVSGRGVQLTPDGKRILVNADVGSERWAIAGNVDDDTITGNVFFVGTARPPAFLWCRVTGRSGGATGTGTLHLSCFGADRCSGVPCGPNTWGFLNNVALPESFLLP